MSRPAARPDRTYLVHLGDQRRSRTDSHGIINFSLGLVHALPASLTRRNASSSLINEESADELGTRWCRPQDEVRGIGTPRSAVARLRVDHVIVRSTARAIAADVVLYPKGFVPVRAPALRSTRQVVCLHDDIPRRQVRDPALPVRRRLRAAYFSALLRWSLRTADGRLFVSEFTASQLRGDSSPRPTDAVIGEGISLPRRALIPVAARKPQAVLFGSTHPHKRTEEVLRLLLADADCAAHLQRVIVVGASGPTPREDARIAVEYHPDPLSTAGIAALLAESRLTVYPSCYEGFGLPPIESYALGTPVVFRRNDAAWELLVGVPGGFDSEDRPAFAAAAREALLLGDDELSRWSDHMWARFSWSDVAGRVATQLRRHAGSAQA